MKIAVCDDESGQREKITEYLWRYSEDNMMVIETEQFCGGGELLASFQKSLFKVVFLDIFMDSVSGVETAFKIRTLDENCAIIFTTSSTDFRAEGFEVGAAHYLIKPITYEAVKTAMNRCKRLFAKDERWFSVTHSKHTDRVRAGDVIYIEVYGRTTLIHTTAGIMETHMPLSEIEPLLGGSPFLRCHRSYIVNMLFIDGVLEEDFLMKNGERVPIHKNGRQKIKNVYTEFLFDTVGGNSSV